jgi:hypothetical protein
MAERRQIRVSGGPEGQSERPAKWQGAPPPPGRHDTSPESQRKPRLAAAASQTTASPP